MADYVINMSAQTVQLNGVTKSFTELGIPKNATREQVETALLDSSTISAFTAKNTLDGDTFVSTTNTTGAQTGAENSLATTDTAGGTADTASVTTGVATDVTEAAAATGTVTDSASTTDTAIDAAVDTAEAAAATGTVTDSASTTDTAIDAAVDTAEAAAATDETGTASGETAASLKAQLDALQSRADKNQEQIDKIEARIEKLITDVEKKIEEATNSENKALKDYEDECKQTAREQVQAYVTANTTGKGMTKDELDDNIKAAMPNEPGLADALIALMSANNMVDEIDALTPRLKSLISSTESIAEQMKPLQTQYDAAVAAEQSAQTAQTSAQTAATSSTQGCCDPIGFEYEGETWDLIIDDGNFDSTSDFLGSENNWAAVGELNKDKDDTLTLDELKEGNIKVVNSKGEVKDISEVIGSNDFSIDLNSYSEGGTYNGIDTTADDDGDGTVNQQLLGTYNININGQTVKGYNTLDDTDYLSNKYGISKGTQAAFGTGAAATGNKGLSLMTTLQSHTTKVSGYETKSEQLRAEIDQAYKDLGFTEDEISELDEVISSDAVLNASNFFTALTTAKDDEAALDDDNNKDKDKDKDKLTA